MISLKDRVKLIFERDKRARENNNILVAKVWKMENRNLNFSVYEVANLSLVDSIVRLKRYLRNDFGEVLKPIKIPRAKKKATLNL